MEGQRRRRGKVWQQGGRGAMGRWEGQLPACAYHQISLMKWVKIVKPSGPGATDILSNFYPPPSVSNFSLPLHTKVVSLEAY